MNRIYLRFFAEEGEPDNGGKQTKSGGTGQRRQQTKSGRTGQAGRNARK